MLCVTPIPDPNLHELTINFFQGRIVKQLTTKMSYYGLEQ